MKVSSNAASAQEERKAAASLKELSQVLQDFIQKILLAYLQLATRNAIR